MQPTRADIAGFYRLGLQLGVVRPEAPVAWADSEILKTDLPDEAIIDLALSAGKTTNAMVDALRQVGDWPDFTEGALRLLGCLLGHEIENGRFTTKTVADLVYAAGIIAGNAEKVFGHEVHWIDEFFGPYAMGPEKADQRVRELLSQFANDSLPPI